MNTKISVILVWWMRFDTQMGCGTVFASAKGSKNESFKKNNNIVFILLIKDSYTYFSHIICTLIEYFKCLVSLFLTGGFIV